MGIRFQSLGVPHDVSAEDWWNWKWQLGQGPRSQEDFEKSFALADSEREGFQGEGRLFKVRTTPYYAYLAKNELADGPLRRIQVPRHFELKTGLQQMLDPLGEIQNNPAPRVIHRYPDRALFLVTDTCSVYCRYCTRKHFTGKDQAFVRTAEYEQAIAYFQKAHTLREVILSGGDPLTLSDGRLEKILSDLRRIEHIEVIRIGSRMPVVSPMRVTPELVKLLRSFKPVFMMTHFNHPKELTAEAAEAVERFVDNGVPVFNQMVLLNGVNNHPVIVRALSRRLLYLRAKPYYMFQCDPSEGTDHLRTSVENSLAIQRELWGSLSGLAMPNLSLDIPGGGGKVGLVPDYQLEQEGRRRTYRGWDGVTGEYISPPEETMVTPIDWEEWID